MQVQRPKRILVTGGTGFLGFRVVMALLELEAEVTLIARPDRRDILAPLQGKVTITHADVWNRASLKGRARGHDSVVHLVGSTHTDPARGLTYNQINLVSARNVTAMTVSDGVPYMVLLSTIMRPLDLPGEYIRSKREAEDYLKNTGLDWTIVRAPALFSPRRHWGLRLASVFGALFPFNLLAGHLMPLSVDITARAIARMAVYPQVMRNRTVYAPQLRRVARQSRLRQPLARPIFSAQGNEDIDEVPFGWLPPSLE
ncbi:MAG: NAD(P)H-binding protein [Anaerolineales bacterium]|nr:NAD(P)H-binding protein [Anaerolineales bacterium]